MTNRRVKWNNTWPDLYSNASEAPRKSENSNEQTNIDLPHSEKIMQMKLSEIVKPAINVFSPLPVCVIDFKRLNF